MNQGKRSLPGIAFIDFLSNQVILFVVLFVLAFLLVKPKASVPSIVTQGYYAVVVTWANGSPDDVDTYVRDPRDGIVYFASSQVDLMHLEQDDLGTGHSNTATSGGHTYKVKINQERTIIQGIIPGEYIVNVQMFEKRSPGPTKVTIRLYKLQGPDRVVTETTVTLRANGDEKTAFRFTLNAAGDITNINHLPKELAYSNLGVDTGGGNGTQPPPSYSYPSYR